MHAGPPGRRVRAWITGATREIGMPDNTSLQTRVIDELQSVAEIDAARIGAVSYTHLTLPTNREV